MKKILGTSKAREFRDILRDQIRQGKYKPGDKIPAVRAFAEKYAINKTTVNSAILNLATEGLLVSYPGKGTFVVKPEKKKNGALIGYLFDSGISRDYPSIAFHIKQLTRKFSANHYSLVADEYPAEGGICENRDFQEKIRSRFFAGLIAYTPLSLEDLVFLKKQNMPLVVVGDEANDPNTASVCADMFESGMMLTEHLVRLGHKKITLLTGPVGNRAGELLELGCRAVMAKYNMSHSKKTGPHSRGGRKDGHIISGPWGEESGQRLVEKILNLKERPTAVIAAEEITALGVTRKLLENGYRIPADFSIAAISDRLPISAYPVPLTVSDTDEAAQILRAADLLMDLIQGKDVNKKVKLIPKLIIRQSCGGPR